MKVKYISLVNLIIDRELVKELIQGEFNVKALQRELDKLEANRETLMTEYDELRSILGGGGASSRAAEIVIEEISK